MTTLWQFIKKPIRRDVWTKSANINKCVRSKDDGDNDGQDHHLVTQVIAFANPFAAFPTGLTQVGFFVAQSPKGNKGMRTVN